MLRILFLLSLSLALSLTDDRHYCGRSGTDCPVQMPDLPDCCTEFDESLQIDISYCCDKNVWRYFVYGALSLIAAFIFLLFWIYMQYPECFERTFGRCWGWIVQCFTCRWLRPRNNFVDNDGGYQTI